jgi:hypothetical protein
MDANRWSPLARVLSLLLALLLIGVLLRYWMLVPGFFRSLIDPMNPPWTSAGFTYTAVVGGFLALLGGATIGLFRRRVWGVYCAYALVPVSTILHGIPLIPFVSDLLPTLQFRIAAVFVLNLMFLTGAVILHLEYRKARRGGGIRHLEGAM